MNSIECATSGWQWLSPSAKLLRTANRSCLSVIAMTKPVTTVSLVCDNTMGALEHLVMWYGTQPSLPVSGLRFVYFTKCTQISVTFKAYAYRHHVNDEALVIVLGCSHIYSSHMLICALTRTSLCVRQLPVHLYVFLCLWCAVIMALWVSCHWQTSCISWILNEWTSFYQKFSSTKLQGQKNQDNSWQIKTPNLCSVAS